MLPPLVFPDLTIQLSHPHAGISTEWNAINVQILLGTQPRRADAVRHFVTVISKMRQHVSVFITSTEGYIQTSPIGPLEWNTFRTILLLAPPIGLD